MELYLNKKKEKNKEVFDRLALKKEIEDELGVNLVWSRGDGIILSKIYYECKDAGIETEENWEKVALFQTKWSKKFYGVFSPYLES